MSALGQAAFAGSVLAAAVGSYMAVLPPNKTTAPPPPTGDLMRRIGVTSRHAPHVAIVPVGLAALRTAQLALAYPDLAVVAGPARAALLTPALFTWSAATAVPLALLAGAVPLRLASYAGLGRNFTFALAAPSQLTTTGLYRYVQHPSYSGMVGLTLGVAGLLGRADGALGSLVPAAWHAWLRAALWAFWPPFLAFTAYALRCRIQQEETLLHARFGAEWEQWHARTARLLPGVF